MVEASEAVAIEGVLIWVETEGTVTAFQLLSKGNRYTCFDATLPIKPLDVVPGQRLAIEGHWSRLAIGTVEAETIRLVDWRAQQ